MGFPRERRRWLREEGVTSSRIRTVRRTAWTRERAGRDRANNGGMIVDVTRSPGLASFFSFRLDAAGAPTRSE